MPLRPLHNQTSRKHLVQFGAFAAGMAVAGSLVIAISQAATYAANQEAEAGALSGQAAAASDSNASGGQAVHFGATAGASCGSIAVSGATTTVTSSSQFTTALANAQAGDTIVLSGNFGSSLSVSGKTYRGAPLVIKAAAAGTNLNSLQITNSDNIVVQGFTFGPNTASTYLRLSGSSDIKILRNTFDGKGITVAQSAIITSGVSQNIDIGCNEFRDKYIGFTSSTLVSGSFIKTQFDAPDNISKNVHIYHNYFHNIAPFLVNGTPQGDTDREAIVLGESDSQSIVANDLIEYNLFEDCDGENEIISVKTSGDTVSHNTFKNSMGSLSLRLGNNSTAEGNYFYGTGASSAVTDPNYQTGGIRLYGSGHTVRNNFMKDLTGKSWRLPLLLDSGDTNNSVGGSGHQVASNIQVTGNTIVDSVGGVYVGSSNYSLQPSGNSLSGNLVIGSQGSLYFDGGTAGSWSGNKAYATGTATAVDGTAKSASEVQILTAAPPIADPGPLTTANVGPASP